MNKIIHGSLKYTSLLIIAILVISYFPVFSADFIWDDDMFVVQNPLMHSLKGLYYIWFSTHPMDYYPITYTSIWLDYHIWGSTATGYHMVNLLLHAANAILLMIIFQQLNIPFAGFAAILFAVHPVNVQSVAWITERKNVLCMFFFALCVTHLLTYEHTQKPGKYLLALSCFLCALLCKSAVLMFPFIILAFHWWKKQQLTRRDMVLTAPFFYLSAIMGMISLWFQNNRAIGETIIRNDSFFSRIINGIYAFGFYIQKSLFPIQLNFVYPVNQSQFPLSLALFGMLILFAFIVWCLYVRYSCGLFGFLYVFLMLFPVLGFVNIYFMRYAWVADHWQYFSLWGVLGILMVGIHWISQKVGFHFFKYILVLWISCFVIGTFTHVKKFKDEPSLWLSTLSNYPECALALNRLGSIHQAENKMDSAIDYYKKTLSFHPNDATAHNNLGMIEESRGNIEKAKKHYSQAILNHPQHPHIYYNLGRIQLKQGNVALAEKSFQTCLNIKPGHEAALMWLATCLEYQQKWPSVSRIYQQLLKQFGKKKEFLNPLARSYEASQNYFQALRSYQDSLDIDTEQADIYYQMAQIYQDMGRIQNAIACGKKAVELDPEYPPYSLFVALLIGEHGSLDETVQYLATGLQINENYQQTVDQLKSQQQFIHVVQQTILEREKKQIYWENNPEQWYQLGNLYLAMGDLRNAQKAFQQALSIDKAHLRAGHNLAWLFAFHQDIAQSIHIFKTILSHHPTESARIYYQMARLCALYGNDICKDDQYLEKAIQAGFRNIKMLQTDPAFQKLNIKSLWQNFRL
jgi:tetratricopeptide (TPR) repeat protein